MDDAATARADLDALATTMGGRDAAADAQRAARERVVAAFRAAGVENEAELAGADPADLAAKTGITENDIAWFQAAARDALRVELDDGASVARLTVGAEERQLPLVIAGVGEGARAALERAGVDAVALTEGASTAGLRYGGARVDGLALWRAGVRVRVVLVRERGAAGAKESGGSFFSRFKKDP